MMSVEGPLIAAIIARMGESTQNLAAYGIAFSIGLIVEAPIIMIMSASTALVKNRDTFLKLRKFTYTLNFAITIIMIVLLIPEIFNFLSREVLGLPDNISKLTYGAVFLLLPWPGAIGYRRFYQGLLIRFNMTRKVAYGTIIRLTAMSISVLVGFYLKSIPGAYVGAMSLSIGVSAEAIASRIMAIRIVRQLKIQDDTAVQISYREIRIFYTPLALTSMVSLGIYPIVTFFLSGSNKAIESLAVLPVISSFIFIFRSLGLSFQEASIALLGDNFEGFEALNRFFLKLGGFILLTLFAISFSPLLHLWYFNIAGLSPDLLEFTETPTRILAAIPFLSLLLSYQRAVLVKGNTPGPVSTATFIEVGGIFIILWVTINQLGWIGVYGAALAFLGGRLMANTFLIKKCLNVIRNYANR